MVVTPKTQKIIAWTAVVFIAAGLALFWVSPLPLGAKIAVTFIWPMAVLVGFGAAY